MIGLATIGQSPRDDVLPAMFSSSFAASVRQAGALDGLSFQEIYDLRPRENEHPLVTRLATGAEVVIAKERVIPHLESAVRALEAEDARIICVLCTGEFNLDSRRARLIYPDRLAGGVVSSVLPSGRLGVVIPHAGQTASMLHKWSTPEREVVIDVLSPYQSDDGQSEPFERLSAAGVDLIVLDCMGYSLEIQQLAAHAVDAPIILSNRLVGAIIESMIV